MCVALCASAWVCTALCARAGVHSYVHVCVDVHRLCACSGAVCTALGVQWMCARLWVCVGMSGCAQALQVCVGLCVWLCVHVARVCWYVKALCVQAGLTHVSTCALVRTLYV